MAAQRGPTFAGMAARCAEGGVAAERVRELLTLAQDPSHEVAGGDEMHLNPKGLRRALPWVRQLATKFDADLVVSDSTLCSVDTTSGEQDRWGSIARAELGFAVWPAWGHSFGKGTGSAFRSALAAGWRSTNVCARILLLIAGNDLGGWYPPEVVHREMDDLKEEWAYHGIDLVYVEVVPTSFQVY